MHTLEFKLKNVHGQLHGAQVVAREKEEELHSLHVDYQHRLVSNLRKFGSPVDSYDNIALDLIFLNVCQMQLQSAQVEKASLEAQVKRVHSVFGGLKEVVMIYCPILPLRQSSIDK